LLVFYRFGVRVGFEMRDNFPAWSAHTMRLPARSAVQAAIAEEGISTWPDIDASG
jgi:glutathione S-transferase